MSVKKIAVLGSTGSVGTQSLDVAKQQGYSVCALSANTNVDLLFKQVAEFEPEYVAVSDDASALEFEKMIDALKNKPVIFKGKNAASMLSAEAGADIVLNAIVGIAGLSSTMAALAAGADVALANKESLVTAGQLVMQQANKKLRRILPVDSEHSAIFQCLQDEYSKKSLKKIILTASGGPFYGKTESELKKVTKSDALKHPNWDMGAKITIDSATLMNKGLELIEAMWLFDLEAKNIEIVVQRESIIHSMVEFSDNSVLAQLGVPDMRIPIQYALTWPHRGLPIAPKLDFSSISSISFGKTDEQTFRCLAACKKAAQKGGLAPCAANGANEEAVRLFLQDKIKFLDIGRLVEACVESDSFAGEYSLEDVYACDAYARKYINEKAQSLIK